jgi:hypothetical protein
MVEIAEHTADVGLRAIVVGVRQRTTVALTAATYHKLVVKQRSVGG